MGKPRNLTDIPDPTFGAMVRALARGEAATMGEAYRQLEAEMNESRQDITARLVEALLDAVADRLDKRAREIVADVAVLAPDRQIESTAQRLARDAVEDFADSIRSGRDGDELRALLAALQPAEVRPDEPAPTPDEVIELLRDPAQTTVEHRVLNNLSVLVALDIAGPEARREIARRMASPPLPPPLPAPVEVRGVVAAVQTAHIPDEITIRCDAPLPGGARWWAGRVVRIVPGGGR